MTCRKKSSRAWETCLKACTINIDKEKDPIFLAVQTVQDSPHYSSSCLVNKIRVWLGKYRWGHQGKVYLHAARTHYGVELCEWNSLDKEIAAQEVWLQQYPVEFMRVVQVLRESGYEINRLRVKNPENPPLISNKMLEDLANTLGLLLVSTKTNDMEGSAELCLAQNF